MKEKLIQLHTALASINTKGYDTLTMADCLQFMSQLIREADVKEVEMEVETEKEE